MIKSIGCSGWFFVAWFFMDFHSEKALGRAAFWRDYFCFSEKVSWTTILSGLNLCHIQTSQKKDAQRPNGTITNFICTFWPQDQHGLLNILRVTARAGLWWLSFFLGVFVCLGKISFVGCSNDGLSTTSFSHVDEDVNLADQSKDTLIVSFIKSSKPYTYCRVGHFLLPSITGMIGHCNTFVGFCLYVMNRTEHGQNCAFPTHGTRPAGYRWGVLAPFASGRHWRGKIKRCEERRCITWWYIAPI